MRRILVIASLVLTVSLVSASPSPAAKSRALNVTQKIAAELCRESKGCTEWVAVCKGPNRKRQWKCKVTNHFSDGGVCRVGLTWSQSGGKLHLDKIGKPRCTK